MKLNITKLKQVNIAIYIIVVMIALISALSYYSNREMVRESLMVDHTNSVLFKLENLSTVIKDEELGQRGFALTNDERFLHTFENSGVIFPVLIRQLDSMVTDNPTQKQNMDTLRHLVAEQYEGNSFIVEKAADTAIDSEELIPLILKNKIIIDSLRQRIDIMKTVEKSLLDVRKEKAGKNALNSQLFILVSTLLSMIIVFAAFITLRNEYNEKLMSENKFRNIFDQSNDIIFLASESLRFIQVNPRAMQLLEYPEAEFLKLTLPQIIADREDAQRIRLFFERYHFVQAEETDVISKTGKKYRVLINVKKHTDENPVYQGILQDITERVTAEQNRQALEKFASTGRIARIIAHEIRNPLTNINLAMQQVSQTDAAVNEEISLLLEIVERNSNRINQLITQLLTSTKFTQLEKKPCFINEVIEETLETAKDSIRLHHVHVEKHFGAIEPFAVDREKMKIALINIIINAVEAVEPEKGVIKIVTRKNRNGNCIISISDNGYGVSEENLKKVFEPFFTGKMKGTGLGLTTAQTIILNHNGTINVSSEEGKGTTFLITLPMETS